jgi:phosphoenolpyruvate synthase/pyruvate phosphate dikinase
MASENFLIPLASCSDPALVGGKAAGLGRLVRSGFHVPPGLCLTIDAFHEALRAAGLDVARQWKRLARVPDDAREAILDEHRRAMTGISLPKPLQDQLDQTLDRFDTAPDTQWAVRSSASNEDATEATYGGLYRTVLGVRREAIAAAVVECWASLWTPAAVAYRRRLPRTGGPPAMAVVLQPLLAPRAAGVAYSRHPVTGMDRQVVINAVFGLAEPLVGGVVAPDQYVVEAGKDPGGFKLLERAIAEKTTARRPSPAGPVDVPIAAEDRERSVLTDEEVLALARLVKDVEAAFKSPVDVEWAMDGQGTWLLQARPIPGPAPLTAVSCVWSRANFKETMPDVPSPLGLSFLRTFMERNILRHYRELGCRIPPGLPSVRVFHGRPYINVTLFQSLTAQLGGDPAVVLEHMGGEERPLPVLPARLPAWRLIRAAIVMEWKIHRAARLAPRWFAEMKQMGTILADETPLALARSELLARLDRLDRRLRNRDLTLALVAGVSQGLQALNFLLERRCGAGWRPLLNASLRGLGTVVSARQIFWLAELAECAQQEATVRAFLLVEPWDSRGFRRQLAGTAFLSGFEAFLAEYGHRAIGESDPGSPRYAERQEEVLDVIRRHVLAPPSKPVSAMRMEQEAARTKAFRILRHAFGWRLHEWMLFRWWHRRLTRYLALREANRHHLMYFTSRVRHLELILGDQLTSLGLLGVKDDIFFLTEEEMRSLLQQTQALPETHTTKDWKQIVAARRAERARYESQAAPDTLVEGMGYAPDSALPDTEGGARLRGLPISAGYVEGPVRLLRSPADAGRVRRGDIIVAPVIDPGMAPVLGLAAGLVVEMGGILSHGAIIAREYGLPAVANVHGVTRLLHDGERIAVDASAGEIWRLTL